MVLWRFRKIDLCTYV